MNKFSESLSLWSTLINLAPANNYITIPAVTEGEIPNSIKVPLLEAKITLNHLKWSAESEEWIPYKGIYEHTKYIITIITVQIALVLKFTFLSGAATSGKRATAGLNNYKRSNPILYL